MLNDSPDTFPARTSPPAPSRRAPVATYFFSARPAKARGFFIASLLALLSVAGIGCSEKSDASDTLTVYSGRSKSLVDPLILRFQEETGITVLVRYGDTAPLALALVEEGMQSPADIFWAQDAGALGAVELEGLFDVLPADVLNLVSDGFKSKTGHWIATSGRARVLAYSNTRMSADEIPESILNLTENRFRSRVGWAPTNGSFQAAISGMRHLLGEKQTRDWLRRMQANGVKSYGNNRGIIEAIANGEIDLGIPNHYYLYRYKADDPDYPVDQTFFAPGDAGNMINVAGVGVLKTSTNPAAALQFVTFLLNTSSQEYFVNSTFEYPVVDGVHPNTDLRDMNRLDELKPLFDLGEISDLSVTLELLRDTEIL